MSSNTPLLRLLAVFAAVFFLLHLGYQAGRGTVLERTVIDLATVKPSAWLINWISGQEQVRAQGASLVSPQTRLSVRSGCESTESMFLLIAAVLAFRSPWLRRLVGLTLGIMVIYLANQIRIVALYFALHHDHALFAALHGYIAPTLIIAVGCIFYLWWMRWAQQKTPA